MFRPRYVVPRAKCLAFRTSSSELSSDFDRRVVSIPAAEFSPLQLLACVSVRPRLCKSSISSVFGSIKNPPDRKQIEYSAFYEVVSADISFRAGFLHSLGHKRTFRLEVLLFHGA